MWNDRRPALTCGSIIDTLPTLEELTVLISQGTKMTSRRFLVLPLVLGFVANSGCEKSHEAGPTSPADATDGRQTEATMPWPVLEEPPVLPVSAASGDAAVIVAIERYDYVAPIKGAIANATAWQHYLVDGRGVPSGNVTLLTDANATRDAIEKALDRAAQKAVAGGKVWFVFIGHGAPSRTGTDGLLLGSDVRRNVDSLESRGVHHRDAIDRLETSAAQPIVVLDACFSGLTASKMPVVEGLQPLQLTNLHAPARAIVFSAAKQDQYAGRLPGARRPAFSYLMLGALRGWADTAGDGDGLVTVDEAVNYVNEVMSALETGRTQTAERVGDPNLVVELSAGESGPDLPLMQRLLARGVQLNQEEIDLPDLPTVELAPLDAKSGVRIVDIDIEREQELERQWDALQLAKQKVENARDAAANDPTGEKQRDAWCDLAKLPEPNPYQDEAEKACAQLRHYVEQRRLLVESMAHDWKEKIVPFMSLRHRSPDQKLAVMKAFIETYGVLTESSQLTDARSAVEILQTGALPKFDMDLATPRLVSEMTREEGAAFTSTSVGEVEYSDHVESVESALLGVSTSLDTTLVTEGQYRACVKAGVCRGRPLGSEHQEGSRGNRVLVNVTYREAERYCLFVGKRLPTKNELMDAIERRAIEVAAGKYWGEWVLSSGVRACKHDPKGCIYWRKSIRLEWAGFRCAEK